jgi:hypothetical protein
VSIEPIREAGLSRSFGHEDTSKALTGTTREFDVCTWVPRYACKHVWCLQIIGYRPAREMRRAGILIRRSYPSTGDSPSLRRSRVALRKSWDDVHGMSQCLFFIPKRIGGERTSRVNQESEDPEPITRSCSPSILAAFGGRIGQSPSYLVISMLIGQDRAIRC